MKNPQDRGDWFPTYTGIKFYPTNPDHSEINIIDIAHALSMQCRFAGHVAYFYSVAQHSVLVSQNVPPELALAGLLHDAAEAYCQDLIRPVKHSPGFEEYRRIELRLEEFIAEKFKVGDALWAPSVKLHDNRALMTERRDLYAPGVGEKFVWSVTAEPYAECIVPWAPSLAEVRFLRRYCELTGERVMLDGVTIGGAR